MTDFRIQLCSIVREKRQDERNKLYRFMLIRNDLFKEFRKEKEEQCHDRRLKRERYKVWLKHVLLVERLKMLHGIYDHKVKKNRQKILTTFFVMRIQIKIKKYLR